ncbi:peptidase, partial [Pseudomonas sp. BAgro211]|nr:peptidase [Pseudomonas sp. BAgro211]
FEQKLTSTKYIAKTDNPLITLAESTGFKQTSDYHQTRAWLQKLADASGGAITLSDLPENSATGEPMLLVTASREADKSAAGLNKSGKP